MGGLVGDVVEWAAETVVDVFDIGGASGNNGGSSDWEAWGHPDLYSMVQSSIDPADVQGGADAYRAIGTRTGESFATFTGDLNGIVQGGWRGASADAATAANAPIQQWAAQLSEAVTRTSDLMTTSGESVEQTRHTVPPPVEYSAGQSLRSAGTGMLAGGPIGAMFGAGADAVAQDREQDEARAQAIQVMNTTYSALLTSTQGSVPTAFPQLTDPTLTPPEVDPRRDPPDIPGKPPRGPDGGPGDGTGGGPGDVPGGRAGGGGGTGGGTAGVPGGGGGGTGGQLPGGSETGPTQAGPAQTGGQFAPHPPGGAGGGFGPSSPGSSGPAGGVGGGLAPAAFGPGGAGGDRARPGGGARGVGAGGVGAGGVGAGGLGAGGGARGGSGGRVGGGAGSAGGGAGAGGAVAGGAAAGRAGAGGAGRGAMPMAGMAGGAGRGQGGDDSEHQPKFMIEADPDAIVGQIDPVAPPVIGADPDVYQRRDG